MTSTEASAAMAIINKLLPKIRVTISTRPINNDTCFIRCELGSSMWDLDTPGKVLVWIHGMAWGSH